MVAHQRGLHSRGLLSKSFEDRVPNKRHLPSLLPDEVASFTAFHEQGLRLLVHDFLRWLLLYYNIELHHLTLSRILHVAVFITL
jgi:hypothetical protein